MLTHLDDTLHHQVASTFDHVGTSDYRFFDRYWFSSFDASGSAFVVAGMGVYKNMNVLDGFGCATHPADGKQYNVRVSRQLRPDVSFAGAGPLRFEVLEPLRRHRLVLEGNPHGLSFDLVWEATSEPHEEGHHFRRRDGRVIEDYRRFDQMGRVAGEVSVGGATYRASHESWIGVRDHSWGVRPGVGGAEIATRDATTAGAALPPGLFNWLCYRVGDASYYFSLWDRSDGARARLDSSVRSVAASGEPRESRLRDVEHELEFYEGTRRVKRAAYQIAHEDGRREEVIVTRVRDPFAWALEGYGYWGYHDGRGLGAYRGRLLVEGETWDVSHPEILRDESGKSFAPAFREGPVRVEHAGRVGHGHFADYLIGAYPRYGFRA